MIFQDQPVLQLCILVHVMLIPSWYILGPGRFFLHGPGPGGFFLLSVTRSCVDLTMDSVEVDREHLHIFKTIVSETVSQLKSTM